MATFTDNEIESGKRTLHIHDLVFFRAHSGLQKTQNLIKLKSATMLE